MSITKYNLEERTFNFRFLRYRKVKKEAKIVGVILRMCQEVICDTKSPKIFKG